MVDPDIHHKVYHNASRRDVKKPIILPFACVNPHSGASMRHLSPIDATTFFNDLDPVETAVNHRGFHGM